MIALLGASGGTGLAVLEAAAAEGVPVRALCRPTAAVPARPGVEILRGKLTDAPALDALLGDVRVVVSVLGPRPPCRDVFCAEATRAVLAAMGRARVRRLVCQTGAMVGATRQHASLAMRILASSFRRRRPEVARDREEQERLVRTSGLDWTIVKPPRLTDGSGSGHVVARADLRVGLLSRVSRVGLARFLVAEALAPRHVGEAVYVVER